MTEYGNTADITLYAKWKPDQYRISFVLGDGTIGDMPAQTITYGEKFDLNPNTTASKRGYTLVGWSRDETETISYEDGQKDCATLAGDIVLYAVWIGNFHTILFDANGGTTDQNSNDSTSCSIGNNGAANQSTNQSTGNNSGNESTGGNTDCGTVPDTGCTQNACTCTVRKDGKKHKVTAVAKNAFKGINKKARFKVPGGKKKAYQKRLSEAFR